MMELAVDFECPDCHRTLTRNLVDLAPGKPRECLDCGQTVVLTESGLKELERRLDEYCRG